jgi:prepilin-type N-terminal cleavage/methylation domain-containing protein
MNNNVRQKGFSLTEVLMATGILAMGLMLVAMAFPVGVKLVSISTERTIADAAFGEAQAKMRLYGVLPFTDPNWSGADPNTTCIDYWKVCATGMTSPALVKQLGEAPYYPSLVPLKEKRYCWSALMRRTDPNTNAVQTTVFVCRVADGGKYYTVAGAKTGLAPVPMKVRVQKISNRQLKIMPVLTGSPEYGFFTAGCKIIEDTTGHPCRVLELKDVDSDGNRDLILLDDYVGPPSGLTPYVWVIPPPIGSGRNPCISVLQPVLMFP